MVSILAMALWVGFTAMLMWQLVEAVQTQDGVEPSSATLPLWLKILAIVPLAGLLPIRHLHFQQAMFYLNTGISVLLMLLILLNF